MTLCQWQIPPWQYEALHMEAIDRLTSDVIVGGQVSNETHAEVLRKRRQLWLHWVVSLSLTVVHCQITTDFVFFSAGKLRGGYRFDHGF